jgi:hypothetical protein
MPEFKGSRKPVVKVWCLPEMSQDELRRMHLSIVATFSVMPIFPVIDQGSMVVLFPPDAMEYGKGEEVVIEVSNFDTTKIKRGLLAAKNGLAARLVIAVQDSVPRAFVQCTVGPEGLTQGFACADPRPQD